MNRFKRDMDKFIGENPRFNESLKHKILLEIRDRKKSRNSVQKEFYTLKYAAVLTLLLAVVTSFLFLTLNKNGQETQTPSTAQSDRPVLNLSGESEHWKATFVFKDLGGGVQERSGIIEYIGEDPQPEEVTMQFIYDQDKESFGGSLRLAEVGHYAVVEPTTCTTCIRYDEEDKIPGIFEWEGQQERLVLTKSKEPKWEESPLFESGSYTIIGEEGRAGFIYDNSEVFRFYPNKINKYMWHFWGSKENLTGTFQVIGTHEDSGEKVIVVSPDLRQTFMSPNNGADQHIPANMALPKVGMWKLEAFFDDQEVSTVFVEVHE